MNVDLILSIAESAKANRGTYSFADKDLDLTGVDVLEVHIGS